MAAIAALQFAFVVAGLVVGRTGEVAGCVQFEFDQAGGHGLGPRAFPREGLDEAGGAVSTEKEAADEVRGEIDVDTSGLEMVEKPSATEEQGEESLDGDDEAAARGLFLRVVAENGGAAHGGSYGMAR